MSAGGVQTLFLDIGGVLLTNGWDRYARQRAIDKFELDKQEVTDRHSLVFDIYEVGKLTLEDYLQYMVFYKKQNFSAEEFKTFMFQQSQPLEGAIEYFKELKKKHGLKVVALSNEPRELNDYRIEKYKLKELYDFFVSSCYVGLRKPDPDIFRMAVDQAQTPAGQSLFVDDRKLYVEMGEKLGIPGLHYRGLDEAKEYFRSKRF